MIVKLTGIAGTRQVVVDATLLFVVFLATVDETCFRRTPDNQETYSDADEIDSGATGSSEARRLAGFKGGRRRCELSAVHMTMRDGRPYVRTVVAFVDTCKE